MEDCCYSHGLIGNDGNAALALTNDGIIDWVAIDVAARGLRPVSLTWVEKDIAAGVMFARGVGNYEIQMRIGARGSRSSITQRRRNEAERIAKAGVLERLERELEYFDAVEADEARDAKR